MVNTAGKGQLIDIGGTTLSPFVDVMDLGEVAGHVTARGGAPAILGMQDYPLVG